MRFPNLFAAATLTFCLLTACAGSRPADNGLHQAQALDHNKLSMIREIRDKQHDAPPVDPRLHTDLADTPHMTAKEYVGTHGGLSAEALEYRVGGNDILTVLVHEEKDLSREEVTVAADGTMTFPFIGRIAVGGMTPAQIESIISKRLSAEGYLVNPHISVHIKEFRSRNVVALGAVKNPGRYSLQAQETLLDMLSRAGGVDFSTGGSRATIMRTETQPNGQRTRLAITVNIKRLFSGEDQFANLPLQNEDVVFIPMAEKVYVMGEVMKPGEYVIEDRDATIIQAIGMAGGFTRIAAPNRTSIIRMENGQEQVITIPVDDITSTGRTPSDITLRDKDIIIVPESYF